MERDKPLLPIAWETNKKRNANESLRLKLTFIVGRLEATRREVASRDANRPEKLEGRLRQLRRFPGGPEDRPKRQCASAAPSTPCAA